MAAETRTAVLVLGMHRSGTSALTRMISLLGADLPANLMPAKADNNETGFWESQDVYRLNDALLAELGSRWDDWRALEPQALDAIYHTPHGQRAQEILKADFSGSELFVLKDPRICRLLPFWSQALAALPARPVVLLPLRNPLEVAGSLQQRDAFSIAKSCVLWLRHVLDAEFGSRAMPRFVLRYDDLLSDWRSMLAPMSAALGVSWPQPYERAATEIDGFLRANLRHHAAPEDSLERHPEIAEWVREAWLGLCELRADGTDKGACARIDRVRANFNHAAELLGPVFRDVERTADKQLRTFERTLQQREQELERQGKALASTERVVRLRDTRIERLESEIKGLRQSICAVNSRLDSRERELVRSRAALERAQRVGQEVQERLAEADAVLALQRARGRDRLLERRQLLTTLTALQTRPRWHRLLRREALGERRVDGYVHTPLALPPRNCFGITLHLLERLRLRTHARRLLATRLFDPLWYIQTNPDLALHGANPVWHWCVRGWREGRQPNPVFDPGWYLGRYPDVAAASIDPLLHYLDHGGAEGRQPGPLFDPAWYLSRYPDVAAARPDPLIHYLHHGAAEARSPNPYFDGEWYLAQNTDVKASGLGAFEHYLLLGGFEGRDPSLRFSSRWYLRRYGDVRRAGVNPLSHYLSNGLAEGRQPLPPEAAVATASHPEVAPKVSARFVGRRERREGARNILLCAHATNAELYGGERSFLDLLEIIASREDHNAYVLVPTVNPAYIEHLLPHAVEVVHVPYRFWTAGGREPDRTAISAIRSYMVERGIDLVHVNTIVVREPLIAARDLRIPSLVHVRESVLADRWMSERIGLSGVDIIAEVLSGADYVIANSSQTAEEFGKSGRTFIVPNTFDLARLDLENRIDPAAIRIGLISSNLPKKGIEDFATLATACAKELPQLRFVMIGPENDFVADLRQRQTSGEIAGNLEFAGYQEHPEQAIALVNIVVNLSHFAESFGRTVAEGLAARRCVIVYDLGAPKQLVQHGDTGFVIPFGEWRAAIPHLRALCEDPQRIVAMGERGRAFIESRYGRAAGTQALIAAYDAAAASAAAPEGAADRILPSPRYSVTAPVNGAPLRIAYFCWHFPVPSETFVLNELRVLVEQGCDIKVFCRHSPHKDFQPDFAIEWQTVSGAAELARRLIETGRSIVHAHFTYPTVTEVVWPACEQARIPFTFIAHAQDIFKHENDRRNRIEEVASSAWCRRVFVLGNFHRDYLIERGVPPHKIVINPNGIELRRFTFREPGATSSRRVCAIHRLTGKKGLRDLVLAAPQLDADGISIDIYGYGEDEAALRELIAQRGIRNVSLLGALPQEEVLAKLSEYDLFACPSVRVANGDMDGIPTSLVEAMAVGTPVITTDVASIPDLVQDCLTGIVIRPGDPDSLAEGILRFFAMNADEVRAMVRHARRAVEERHDVRKLVSVLRRVWTDTPVDIVIVSWNNLPQLREVVARVFRYTKTPFHLTICDNASRPDVLAFLHDLRESHDNVTLVLRGANTFVGPGTNAAVAQGRAPYAIYLCGKEGFVLAEGWETALVDYMDRHPDVGLGGTLCYSPSYFTGADYAKIPEFPRFRNPEFAQTHATRTFQHVQGGLFIMRRCMVDEIGGFSDAVPHAYTDVEYSHYVESRGWKLGQIPGMLALYNKTRPDIWSRVDEHVRVIHPPKLDDLPLLDRLVRRELRLCNVCGWSGPAFETKEPGGVCPACRAEPAHRNLYRFLAESTLTFRQLPALFVDVPAALRPFLHKAFDAEFVSAAQFRAAARDGRRCELLVWLAPASAPLAASELEAAAASVLASGGCCIAGPVGDADGPAVNEGWAESREIRYRGAAFREGGAPLLVLRRHRSDLGG